MHALALDITASIDHWSIGKIFLADRFAFENTVVAYSFVGVDCHALSGQAGVHALEIVYNASADSSAIGKIFLADQISFEDRPTEYVKYLLVSLDANSSNLRGGYATFGIHVWSTYNSGTIVAYIPDSIDFGRPVSCGGLSGGCVLDGLSVGYHRTALASKTNETAVFIVT